MKRVSVIGNPVCRKALSPVLTVMEGTGCLSRANAPATCGAAIDVPLKYSYPPPRTDEAIDPPGASGDRKGAMPEKSDTSAVGLLDPTLTADEIHAGVVSDDPETLLPEATTLAIPSDRKLSILGFSGSLSQGAADKSPPRLMFAAAI